MASPTHYKSVRYTGKNVQVLMSERMVRFLRLTDNNHFLKELYKGGQKSLVFLMNNTKGEIQKLKAVYSGFMRSNVISWMDITAYNPEGKINGYVGTRAWYDILVHEGIGPHANPPQKQIPSQYQPTATQLAVAPSWASKAAMMGGMRRKRGGGAGSRPFLRNAVEISYPVMLNMIADGAVKGMRNSLAHVSNVPKHNIDKVFGFLNLG